MTIERYLHDLWSNRVLDALAAAAAVYGLYVCIALLGSALLRVRPRSIIVPLIVGAAAAALLDVLAGLVYQDQRPFVTIGVVPLVPHGPDNGFPSDHSAAAAFASTIALYVDRRLGIIAWAAAVLLGLGRLYCLLHSPLDIAAGWSIGAAPAIAAGVYWKNRSASAM
jgi:undecaprenyl-diphosphatase